MKATQEAINAMGLTLFAKEGYGSPSITSVMPNNDLNAEEIRKYMKKAYFIPEKTALSQQLVEFKNNNQKTGFAVDEYGNIQGLITIEDIFEEIVGDYLEETKKLNKDPTRKKIKAKAKLNAYSQK